MKTKLSVFSALAFIFLLVNPAGVWGGDKDTLIVALEADVTTLDPHMHVNTPEYNILSHVFDHLVEVDKNMKIIPWLARSWTTAPDQVTWTFSLQKNAKFHNGYELTADDVKFSIERMLDPKQRSPQAYKLQQVKEVKALEPHVVQIVTKSPFPTLLGELRTIEIMSRRTVGEMGSKVSSHPIGSGPFKFIRWERDDRIELEPFPGHPTVKPKLRRLVFRIIPEVATRVAELRAGTVDVIKNVPPSEIKSLEKNPDIKTSRSRSLRVLYVGFRHDRKPLDDKRVRQAIALAIDKESIAKHLLEGYASVVANPSAPDCFGSNLKLQPYPFDPEKAKNLLREAGFSQGFKTVFDSPSGKYLGDKEISSAIVRNLAKVGIEASLRASEYGTFLQYVNKEPALFLFAWGASVPDADNVFYRNFHTSSKTRIKYVNPEVDRLLDLGRSTLNAEERKKAYFRVQEIFHEELPWVPLVVLDDVLAMRANVMNFESRTDERLRFFETYKK